MLYVQHSVAQHCSNYWLGESLTTLSARTTTDAHLDFIFITCIFVNSISVTIAGFFIDLLSLFLFHLLNSGLQGSVFKDLCLTVIQGQIKKEDMYLDVFLQTVY